jgi:hypothetical protein
VIDLLEINMGDDLQKRGQQDDDRIDIAQEHELSYWASELGVSRDALKNAIAKVGPMVKDVRAHLYRQRRG